MQNEMLSSEHEELRRQRQNGADFGNRHTPSLLYWRIMREIIYPEVLL